MRLSLVPIGNSLGIRIPKTLLKMCRIQREVEVNVKRRSLIIHPVRKKARQGWEEAFRAMHAAGEDRLLMDDALDLDVKGWEW